MTEQLVVGVTEISQVAEVRRQVVALAGQLAFTESEVGKVAIVVTEAATNLVKHAAHGEIVVRPLEIRGQRGIEILALDKGPGITNLTESLRDGFSTTSSPGTGLGAISRLAFPFDLHSVPAKGTALLAQVWSGRPSASTNAGAVTRMVDVGVICRAKRNEIVCGDAWETASLPGRTLFLVVDGLGHGVGAATAAREAARVFGSNLQHNPARIVEFAHAALRPTRGAVLVIAELDPQQEVVRYAGVGNVSGVIISAEGTRHLVSTNGTVGHNVRNVREFSYPFPRNAVLILHSDGLATHWNLDQYPGLLTRSPSLIAGVLYRDHHRGNDDVTVMAARVAT